jgi:hypothetical protein
MTAAGGWIDPQKKAGTMSTKSILTMVMAGKIMA